MPRDVCTMAKGVRCGKPFSMNEMLERGGEKAKARRRSSLLGRSTGWLIQPIDGGFYNPIYLSYAVVILLIGVAVLCVSFAWSGE